MNTAVRSRHPLIFPDFLWIVYSVILFLMVLFCHFFQSAASLIPECIFKRLTGIPCPTCGLTRSILAISRLEPFAAIAFNPLLTVSMFIMVLFCILSILFRLHHRSFSKNFTKINPRFLRFALISAILVNWAYLILNHI